MRKFRRSAEPALRGIEARTQVLKHCSDGLRRKLGSVAAPARQQARQRVQYFLILCGDFPLPVAPDSRNPLAQLRKARQTVTGVLREIRSAEKGRAVRRKEHREGPAAA